MPVKMSLMPGFSSCGRSGVGGNCGVSDCSIFVLLETRVAADGDERGPVIIARGTGPVVLKSFQLRAVKRLNSGNVVLFAVLVKTNHEISARLRLHRPKAANHQRGSRYHEWTRQANRAFPAIRSLDSSLTCGEDYQAQ